MKRRLKPEQMWSITASAVYGWLTGLAASAVCVMRKRRVLRMLRRRGNRKFSAYLKLWGTGMGRLTPLNG
jgi:hypothetical protein